MIRLFAAIAMPREIGAMLAARSLGLPGAAWRAPESLHLTLRFGGDMAETAAADFEAELAVLGGDLFALEIAGVGSFGDRRGERALWAGVSASQALDVLAGRCERAARRAGLAAERRGFRPHVTLAYLRGADPSRVAAWISANNLLRSPPFEVASFGLYSSRRAEGGPAYRLERLYRLG